MKSVKLIFAVLSLFVLSCNTNKENMLNQVEYGISGYYDTGFDSTELCERRIITLLIKFVNNQEETTYIPICYWKSTQICSRLLLYYQNHEIRTFISKPNTFNRGVINAKDTTCLRMILYGSYMRNAGIPENIEMSQLLPRLSLKYELCEKDSVYSNYPLPKKIQFVSNDSVLSINPKIKQ